MFGRKRAQISNVNKRLEHDRLVGLVNYVPGAEPYVGIGAADNLAGSSSGTLALRPVAKLLGRVLGEPDPDMAAVHRLGSAMINALAAQGAKPVPAMDTALSAMVTAAREAWKISDEAAEIVLRAIPQIEQATRPKVVGYRASNWQ